MLQAPIKLESFRRISLEWFVPLVYAIGLAYIALLPELALEYYVDENAFIVHSIQAASTVQEIKPALDLPGPEQVSSEFIQRWLSNALETPSISIRGFDDDVTYAILRSRRSNGEDSIALVIPTYESEGSLVSGIHVAVALLRYLKNVKWLAKDIILLCVPFNKPEAVSKWVTAYHSDHSNWNSSLHLPMERAGAIRAALILDLPPSTMFNALSLVCQTGQGALPNFDMVTIIQYMMQQHNIPLSISDHYNSSLLKSSMVQFAFLERWRPMLRFMADTLYSSNADLYAPFIDHNIDALSLIATGATPGPTNKGVQYVSLVHALEETVRAFSNLIEKLHHSSFLYVLTSSTKATTFIAYYWASIVVATPWPLSVIHRLENDLPLQTMWPAFQAFSLLLCLSISLRYLPSLFQAGFWWNVGLWLLGFLTTLLTFYFYIPKQISWAWFHSFIALMSLIVVLPYSVLNFTVTTVVVFATVPLVLVKPPTSRIDHFRNLSLLLLSSPVIPLILTSLVFETSVLTLLKNFFENLDAPIHHIYPLVYFLYLPNYIAAVIVAFFFKPTHIKTD